MIHVTFYRDPSGGLKGFQMKGHAEYAEYGQDIVCAAVSALAQNAVNSVETFTDDIVIAEEVDEETGMLTFMLQDPSNASRLLLDSLALGLEDIEESYGNSIQIVYEEE